MNGVHDLGGMHGFGPIQIDPDEPMFHASWEPRLRALTMQAMRGGLFNLDAFRYGIERMDPAVYLTTPYHERWLESTVYNVIHQGWINEDELETWIAHLRERPDAHPPSAAPVEPPPIHTSPAESPSHAPRFAVGDAVVARNDHPVGHTRLARYVRGKRGVIHLVHPPEVFPDTNAHGLGEHMQVVYNVRFDASDLWGPSAEPRQTVSIDLWESYLDPAEH